MTTPLTNQQLREFVVSLGFTSRPSPRSEKHVILEHAESGARLALPANKDTEPAKAADLLSVRTHLHYRGHVDAAGFDQFCQHSGRQAS